MITLPKSANFVVAALCNDETLESLYRKMWSIGGRIYATDGKRLHGVTTGVPEGEYKFIARDRNGIYIEPIASTSKGMESVRHLLEKERVSLSFTLSVPKNDKGGYEMSRAYLRFFNATGIAIQWNYFVELPEGDYSVRGNRLCPKEGLVEFENDTYWALIVPLLMGGTI